MLLGRLHPPISNESQDLTVYSHTYVEVFWAALQVLVEAVTSEGLPLSLQLQNAETVKLVGPSALSAVDDVPASVSGCATTGDGAAEAAWRAISVSELGVGDRLLVLLQEGARHTGIAIEESIVER